MIGKDEEIIRIGIIITAIEILKNFLECMTVEEIGLATTDDEHMGMLLNYILHGWTAVRVEV